MCSTRYEAIFGGEMASIKTDFLRRAAKAAARPEGEPPEAALRSQGIPDTEEMRAYLARLNEIGRRDHDLTGCDIIEIGAVVEDMFDHFVALTADKRIQPETSKH